MARLQTIQELDPALALRSGRVDSTAVLVLWCLRKAFYPLLWLGLILATVSDRADEIEDAGGVADYVMSFESPGEVVAALLSPLIVVLLAFALRVAVAGLAFALAYPLTTWNSPADYAHGRKSQSRTRVWTDRLHLTRAYRSLRWTWAVRQVAAARLGHLGRRLQSCTSILRWASILLFVAYIVAASLTMDA